MVATARNTDTVTAALGQEEDLMAVKLEVTDPSDAEAAVQAAVDRFGRIDVLVNNAGNFYAGFFEEISPDDFRAQVETTLFGPTNVTRAYSLLCESSGLASSSQSPRPPASWAKSSAPRAVRVAHESDRRRVRLRARGQLPVQPAVGAACSISCRFGSGPFGRPQEVSSPHLRREGAMSAG